MIPPTPDRSLLPSFEIVSVTTVSLRGQLPTKLDTARTRGLSRAFCAVIPQSRGPLN